MATHEIYLWVCPHGHYVGMSTLGSENPDYGRAQRGKKNPKCHRCKGEKELYIVTKMKKVKR